MEERIIELEKRVTFQDAMLDTLNDIITKQQDQLDNLENMLRMIQDSQNQSSEIANTPPPHY